MEIDVRATMDQSPLTHCTIAVPQLKSCASGIEPLFANYANETPHDGTPSDAFTSLVMRHTDGDRPWRPSMGEERG